jgi:O-antigen/teichoic acid export membrane protein
MTARRATGRRDEGLMEAGAEGSADPHAEGSADRHAEGGAGRRAKGRTRRARWRLPDHLAGRLASRLMAQLAGNMAGRIGALAALGVATILVARAGGPELVGAFTLVRVLPGMICHLSNCGLPGAAPYFLAADRYDQSRVRPTIAALTVGGAVLGGLIWLALAPLLYALFFESFGMGIALAAAIPALTQGFVSVGKGLLQGTGDLRGASLAIAVEEVIYLPIYGLLLVWWYGAGMVVAGLVLADIAAAVWIAVRLARRGFFTGWRRPDLPLGREICGYGMRGQIGSLIDLLNLRLDVALLGAIAGPAALGVYTVASKVAELTQLPGLAVNYVLYPAFARDRATAGDRAARLIVPALVASALVAVPLALVVGPLLPRIFTHSFDGAIVPTYILLCGLVAFGAGALIMAYLYGIGRPGVASIGQSAGLVVTLALDLLLIPRFGAIGAAIASTVAYVTTTTLLLVWFARLRSRPADRPEPSPEPVDRSAVTPSPDRVRPETA